MSQLFSEDRKVADNSHFSTSCEQPLLLASLRLIAHLVNQAVLTEVLALEVLVHLLEEPTDDSVEVAVGFMKECGAFLQENSPTGLHGIFIIHSSFGLYAYVIQGPHLNRFMRILDLLHKLPDDYVMPQRCLTSAVERGKLLMYLAGTEKVSYWGHGCSGF